MGLLMFGYMFACIYFGLVIPSTFLLDLFLTLCNLCICEAYMALKVICKLKC